MPCGNIRRLRRDGSMIKHRTARLLHAAAAGSLSYDPPFKRHLSSNSRDTCKGLKETHLDKVLQNLCKVKDQHYDDLSYTYVCLLQGCIQSNSLENGRLLHSHIVKSGWNPNVYMSTALVNMYARCDNMEDAQVVFKSMPERNLVTWNMMISAYCNHERFEEALSCFLGLQKEGLTPNDVSFVSALKACAGLGILQYGDKIHGLLKNSDIRSTILMENSLVNMYIKCGSMEKARQVFDEMDEREASSWNTIIAGYVKRGLVYEAVRLFSKMQSTHVKPDEVTYLIISNACATLGDLEQARQTHTEIKRCGIALNTMMWNTLIDMYAKCGSLIDAQELFYQVPERDISTWNALIGGFLKQGRSEEAFHCYVRMNLEGYTPNDVSYVLILTACTALEDFGLGKQIHSWILNSGTPFNIFVKNALIDMYANCGGLINARHLFDQMSVRSVISWNTMLGAFAKHGFDHEVLNLFEKMESEGTKPDQATFVSILHACASLAALEHGLEVHHGILLSNLEQDLFLGNALVDMYVKNGRLGDACRILDRMLERDAVSWNTMLAGYGQHGLGYKALQLADRMLIEGVEFNHVSFVGILTACSHGGLMDEGWYCFSTMTRLYGVKTEIEHYGCMIDLLGRAGHLHEAEGLIKGMRLEATALLWRAFLGACRTHGNLHLAVHAAERILDMEPDDTAAILLVSNVCAWASGWEDESMLSTPIVTCDEVESAVSCYGDELEVNNKHAFLQLLTSKELSMS